MLTKLIPILCFYFCLPLICRAQQARYQKTPQGVVLYFHHIPGMTDHQLQITILQDSLVHVKAVPEPNSVQASAALAVIDSLKQENSSLQIEEQEQNLLLTSAALKIQISRLNGQISFMNLRGDTLLREQPRSSESFKQDLAAGDVFYALKQDFKVSTKEGLYGLGQHQNGVMDWQGRQITLLNYNTEVAVPFLVSTKNYGILWNNYSITKAGDTRKLLPLSALRLYGKTGEEGWLTASYLNKDNEQEVYLSRPESDVSYNDLSDLHKFPEGVDLSKSLIRYEGTFSSPLSGLQRLHFKYAGYIQVWIDGQLLQDRWRESWNAGSFELDLSLQANEKHQIRIDWKSEGGQSYLGIQWQRPLTAAQEQQFAFASEAGDAIDYYFVYGKSMDQVISGYRKLTGKAPIMPRWVFGYWQSRERYKTQQEILDVAQTFRKKKIPLDNIVLDWSYWPEKDWGGQNFDLERFPDAAGMLQKLHQEHLQLMISTWPKFNEESTTFSTFMKNGWLYKRNIADGRKDWIGKGYTSTFYDPFNPAARKAFWKLLNEKLYQKGVDAFWMDASEPDIHSNISVEDRKSVFQPQIGSSTRYYNAFPLQNAKGIYEGQRETDPDKRVFMLTRSGFAGQQRYAAATWSGDIASTWEDMKDQIAAGLNFSMSGLPYWTMDAGGFLVEKKYQQARGQELEDWRELNTRWYQFGAFTPLFRVHGQFPYREPFNIAPDNHPAYQSMLYYIRLRYRLLPYSYTLAGKAYHENYTLMRGLAMDFTADTNVYHINDQFMYGPDLMVSPVTKKGIQQRSVYLPLGTSWYDLYHGQAYTGGQHIEASAPYNRIPVFVKAGAIIPFGPDLQYTSEKKADPITLYVYDGADGSFTLYEDEGTNYQYEKGHFRLIDFRYDHRQKTLYIGESRGSYPNQLNKRSFRIRFISSRNATGIDDESDALKTITYQGHALSLKLE